MAGFEPAASCSQSGARRRVGVACADTRRLSVEDLLPQDVCVFAVLSEFAQYVQVNPAQRERPAPVTVDLVVQFQG
jgi:hypothetical protein